MSEKLQKQNRKFIDELYGIDRKTIRPRLATDPCLFLKEHQKTIKKVSEERRIDMMLSIAKELNATPNTEGTVGHAVHLRTAADRVFASLSKKGQKTFADKYTELLKKFPPTKKADRKRGTFGERFVDDQTVQFLIGADGPALWLRVGPVFSGNKATKEGLWINFQERYQASPLQGEMVISKKTWEKLKATIDAAFSRKSK